MADSLQEFDAEATVCVVLHNSEDLSLVLPEPRRNRTYFDLSTLKKHFPDLETIESDRSRLEYIYALSPYLVKYFFENTEAESVTYIDADLYFFKSISDLTSLATIADVGLVPHRFKPEMKHLEGFGKYNVGLVQFNRTPDSLAILNFWLNSCRQSTSTFATETVFGDQKYLESFKRYGKVFEFQAEGINAAPWNTNEIKPSEDGFDWLVGEDLLYFYHFSGLKIFKRFATLSFIYYEWNPKKSIKVGIYTEYVNKVITKDKQIFGKRIIDFRKVNLRQMLRFIVARDFILIRKSLKLPSLFQPAKSSYKDASE